MIYSVRHTTTFQYEPAIRESVMEVRVQPRNDAYQRCLSFNLEVDPPANIMVYRDFVGNTVHHFGIAKAHSKINVVAHAVVELNSTPANGFNAGDWSDLDHLIANEDHWEMLLPSHYAQPTPLLEKLARECNLERRGNPYELLVELNSAIYQKFSYVPNSTKVDSPIDDALASRQGVCQDFAHIMIALVRQLRIPCRYVSGYLFRGDNDSDRSPQSATHAWVEALVPKLGWIAFDPTNDLIGGERHIRVAFGRDYADVPPTKGVYKGETTSKLGVNVTVTLSDAPLPEEITPVLVVRSRAAKAGSPKSQYDQQQQQ